ncbi:MAG: class I SAM-dependent methyltransferase [Candidatus Thorarchaeota archaeon]
MAHYRAQESKRNDPLFIDPFAERLAGDLSLYIEQHKRTAGTGDYTLVRSYYIDMVLLAPWCEEHSKSQIVLLGAGLDSRAYRFEPLARNAHTLFEVDFPIVNKYKEEVLRGEEPLCNLVRVSADLSGPSWMYHLMDKGFSQELPTFWVLEGLVYYLEQDLVVALLQNINIMSGEKGQIFVDVSVPALADLIYGAFTRYFKWGLEFENVPAFFDSAGWEVSVAYADDYDQGRDVGQRGLMFVHGVKSKVKAIADSAMTEVPHSMMTSDEIISGIERLVEAYEKNQTEGMSAYLDFIKEARPTIVSMVQSLHDVTSIGQISPRLLRDPLKFGLMANGKTMEEKAAHIIGYLKAIILLVYCVKKGLEGWQFKGTPLHEESLRTQNQMNTSVVTSLVAMLRQETSQ